MMIPCSKNDEFVLMFASRASLHETIAQVAANCRSGHYDSV